MGIKDSKLSRKKSGFQIVTISYQSSDQPLTEIKCRAIYNRSSPDLGDQGQAARYSSRKKEREFLDN